VRAEETDKICDREKKSTSYYVYLLLCDDGSYYTGYTSNVNSRLERHEKGHGARYTRMHRPMKLVHVEEFKTRRAAMRRECSIKALTHDQKYNLTKVTKACTRFR
jgi:putative endonuclease